MTPLRAGLMLLTALVVQTAVGQVWHASGRFIDLLIVPVVLYGVAGSQRAALLVGCAAGLVADAWFGLGVFGLNGFKWTLLGYALAALCTRLDLAHPPGRAAAGAAIVLADAALDVALRALLDQDVPRDSLGALLATAVTTGVLAAISGSIVERVAGPLDQRPGI